MKLKIFVLSVLALVATGCNESGPASATPPPSVTDATPSPEPAEDGLTCNTQQLEAAITKTLSELLSEHDFSFSMERADGRRFSYNRGASTMQTTYESASTSKMVTSAVIMRLVEKGLLRLADRPQDLIPSWPIPAGDRLYDMTLRDLLSFTSGLTDEPACVNQGGANFEACVKSIANLNMGNGIRPGDEFYYASTHMQVAGLMAMKAVGVATWTAVFNQFRGETGLFPTGVYDLPSAANPRLAGGMHWKGEEYLAFLKAFKSGQLLSSTTRSQMLADQTANAKIVNSPALAGLGEDWHYGLGLWQECQSPVYNCVAGTRVSSPGAYGAYPFWDIANNYIGMLAIQTGLGGFRRGTGEIERAIRADSLKWANCR